MIGEDRKAQEVMKSLKTKFLKKIDRTNNSLSSAYQSLLQAVRSFNLGTLYLRKTKTASMVNPKYDDYQLSELSSYEPYHNYFHKVTEILTDQLSRKRVGHSENKKRYYSGDFRVTYNSKASQAKDSYLGEAMEVILAYAYYTLGVLTKSHHAYNTQNYFKKAYKIFSSLRNTEMLQVIKQENYPLEFPDQEVPEPSLPISHMIFNTMFGVSDRFVIFITRLYDLEMPHFTYYTALSVLPNASRSTSQNVRLELDSVSSPMSKTNFRSPSGHRKAEIQTLDDQNQKPKPIKKRFSETNHQKRVFENPQPKKVTQIFTL